MFRLLHLYLIFGAAAARAPKDRPNFVMLFVDDMGYGDTGFNGNASVPTPNIDRLAFDGKILTTWYSGCPICTGSRAALMTGRQYPRSGIPGGIGPAYHGGLPPSELTIAEQLKKANYSTAAVGKWHLGQRKPYLPGSKGFDQYLGVPYSNDMGQAFRSNCSGSKGKSASRAEEWGARDTTTHSSWDWKPYYDAGYIKMEDVDAAQRDPGSLWLPLIQQSRGSDAKVLEQPLDLTTLSEKYSDFAVSFIQEHKDEPFFLYVPFSHVHSVFGHSGQYSGCRSRHKHASLFLDALAETDWMVGNIYEALQDAGILENTLILFTGDNGPQLAHGEAAGSTGILTGSSAGYWNTGKGSTWEGGIRSASFAYWKGQIQPHSRSSEVISSMDVFPTLSKLAGVDVDANRVYDGKDMSQVLLQPQGKSKHDFLFFYGGCNEGKRLPSAVRHGRYKAHFCTGPGLGGCGSDEPGCGRKDFDDAPLLFDVVEDPSESQPLNPGGVWCEDNDQSGVLKDIMAAFKTERSTFSFGEPDNTQEKIFGPYFGICCNRATFCICNSRLGGFPGQKRKAAAGGFLAIGTGHFHDRYHDHEGAQETL